MKFKKYIIIAVLYFSLTAINVYSQQADDMNVWMEYMTPGAMHQLLGEYAGEWNTTIKFWMSSDSEPLVSEGMSVNEIILGGRYLQSKHSGVSMGMPMEGISIEGFDKGLNKFVSIWLDNMGTGIMYSEGVYDEEEKAITYAGKSYDPMAKKYVDFKQISRFLDKNNMSLEFYMIPGEQEIKTMEVIFKRK